MDAVYRMRGCRSLSSWLVVPAVVASGWLVAAPSQAQTAQFRVTEVQRISDQQAKVTLHWTYSKGNGSYNSYTGDGVKFRIFDKLPGRWHGEKDGIAVKDTVDMKGGTGVATLTVPLPKNAKPGSTVVLTGQWKSGHRWGTDSTRSGGQFTLPKEIIPQQLQVNKATAAELTQLSGIGPSLANRIITFRDQQKGQRIRSVDSLTQVKGISAAKLVKLSPFLTTKAPPKPKKPLSVNINTATEAQFLALPGVGASRAKAIIVHRDKMKQSPYKYSRKFNQPRDLGQVAGISYGLAQKLTPMLKTAGRTTGVPRVKKNSGLRAYRGRWLRTSRGSTSRFQPRRTLRPRSRF